MKAPTKICIFCEHFHVNTAEPFYSEYTPGGEASIECMKDHWTIDNFEDSQKEYRDKLTTARTCKDYLEVK